MRTRESAELATKLQTLGDAIVRLRRRGTSINEDDTKRVLISPLLGALGWDTLEVDEVRSEYRHKSPDNPVDYALFLLRDPALFVEAKALGKSLDDRKWISQTIGYAATVGVEWCVLTNGDEYRLYNAHAALDAEEKLFRTVSISDSAGASRTLETLQLLSKVNMMEKRLDVLWKVEFVDKRVRLAFESLLSRKDEALVRLLVKRARALAPKDVRASLGRARLHLDFPVASVAPTVYPAAKSAPAASNGRKLPTRSGVELADLIDAGLVALPMALEATWRKRKFTATIAGPSEVIFNGKSYTSVSTAAGMARNVVNGQPPDGRPFWQTNGWTFWKYRDSSTGLSRPLSDLRKLSKS